MYSDYRRNSDERLRRLERSNDLQKRVSLIANRVRAGKIYPLEVRVAAYLGDSAALIYMDGDASLGDRHTSREQLSQTYSTFVATPVTEALQRLAPLRQHVFRGLFVAVRKPNHSLCSTFPPGASCIPTPRARPGNERSGNRTMPGYVRRCRTHTDLWRRYASSLRTQNIAQPPHEDRLPVGTGN